MASSLAAAQLNRPSVLSSSFSDFNGAKLTFSVQCKRKPVQPRGALNITASGGGIRFIGMFLSRLFVQEGHQTTAFAASRREVTLSTILSGLSLQLLHPDLTMAQPSTVFKEYIDTFDGYSFKYPRNWISVRGAGADIFFRDPFVLDENLSVDISSPSSSTYKSVEDLGSPEEAGKKVLKQYLTEFMSTRLGVRRESKVLSTNSRVADDGRMYYQVEVNIKSYANNNEMAVMPQDRVVRLEWDRRYLAVLGVENNQLYQLRIQAPERLFEEEEGEIRQVMDSFRVNKVIA